MYAKSYHPLHSKLSQNKTESIPTQEEVSTANNVIELPSNDIFVFPGDYTAVLNEEENRKGSFLAYDLKTTKGNFSSPYFSEIYFFTQDSIKKFN